MSIQTVFKTPDGKEFKTMAEAQLHIDANAKLKKEIREDISRILLKLQNYKKAEAARDDDGYYTISNESELEDKYLCTLKAVLIDITGTSDYTVERYLTKYYNSTCY